jgi:hypothetical protein
LYFWMMPFVSICQNADESAPEDSAARLNTLHKEIARCEDYPTTHQNHGAAAALKDLLDSLVQPLGIAHIMLRMVSVRLCQPGRNCPIQARHNKHLQICLF